MDTISITILVSFITAYITAKIIAANHLREIDSYAKEYMQEILSAIWLNFHKN